MVSATVKHVPALDAIRGIAITGVVATHSLSEFLGSTGSTQVEPMIFRLFGLGAFGVQLFFALSGWLLFHLYWDPPSFRRGAYWKRRLARILPLWVIFGLVYFLVLGNPVGAPATWLSIALVLSFMGWVSPALTAVPQGATTIVNEMLNYSLFSFLRGRSINWLVVLAGSLFATYFLALAATSHSSSIIQSAGEAWLRLGMFRSWPYFVLGGCGYLLARRLSQLRSGEQGKMALPSPGLVAAVVMLGFLVPIKPGISNLSAVGVILVAAGLALILNSIQGIGAVLRSLGKYSYFMYFFHFWVVMVLGEVFGRWIGDSNHDSGMLKQTALLLTFFGLTMVLSWAPGFVSWRLVERPILTWARKTS